MNFMQWFKGYGADNELKFENDKLKKEISQLHVKQQAAWDIDTINANRRDALQKDNDRLYKVLSGEPERKESLEKDIIEFLRNKIELESKIKMKDIEMATFADEINRLKKLIQESKTQESKDKGIPPIAQANTIPTVDGKDPKVTKEPYIKGKGNDRTKKGN